MRVVIGRLAGPLYIKPTAYLARRPDVAAGASGHIDPLCCRCSSWVPRPAAASRCPLALALLLCGSLVLGSGSAGAAASSSEMLTMTSRFRAWRAAHNRTYATAAERQRRFEVYRRNVAHIEATNRRGGLSYQLGENQFTDLTSDEFLAAYAMPPGQVLAARDDEAVTRQPDAAMPRNGSSSSSYSGDAFGQVPYSVDWRAWGAVTPIKHQMACGSCWAFAAVASIESLYKLRTGRLVSLSEQELVDCASPPNYGCNGGDPAMAMGWVARSDGLATAWEYPYESKQGQCIRRGRIRLGSIRGGAAVAPNSEATLERAVAQQPVAVSINAATFQHYRGGVLSGPCDAGINHAVTVVGYGADAGGLRYWIAKNSWGVAWGENGVRAHGGVLASPAGPTTR